MKKVGTNFLRILLAIIIFFYTSIPILIILRIIGLDITSANLKMIVVYDFISSLIVSIFISLIYYDVLKEDIKKLKEKYQNKKIFNYLKEIMIYFLILLAVKIISAYVVTIISTILGIEVTTADNQATIEKMVNSLPLLITVSASLFAPISEEVLFRGGIRKLMNTKGVFITVSGLIFGLMHVTDNLIFILEILFIGIIINYIINNKDKRKYMLSVLAIVLILLISGIIYYLEFGNIIIKIMSLNISEIINSVSYIALGMYLAYLYTKENNIFINIGVHALNNILSMIVLLLFV